LKRGRRSASRRPAGPGKQTDTARVAHGAAAHRDGECDQAVDAQIPAGRWP
jgi:hypothetical protein